MRCVESKPAIMFLLPSDSSVGSHAITELCQKDMLRDRLSPVVPHRLTYKFHKLLKDLVCSIPGTN